MDPETPHQPHDKLLKHTLSQPENARSFFEHQLPADIPPLIDWYSLQQLPVSFIDPRFQSSESDLLFSVSLLEKPALLYILFEHQSSEDPRIALRLFGYIARLWERFSRDHPLPAKLPPVFPVVLAHGGRPWQPSTELADLLDIPEMAKGVCGKWQPTLRYFLVDLFGQPYTALKGTAETALMLRLLKAARADQLLEDWVWDESLLERISAGARELWMRYLYFSGIDREAFFQRVESLHSLDMKTATLTLAQQIEEKGREEGREEGRQEGLQEGRQEGRQEGAREAARQSVLRALRIKHGHVPEELRQALNRTNDLARLESLLDHAFLSDSLELFTEKL